MKVKIILALLTLCINSVVGQEKAVHVIKAGTIVPLQAVSKVRGAFSDIDEIIDFKVSRNIMDGNNVVIPEGSIAKGKVYEAKRSSWWGTKGRLGIKINYVTLPNGEKVYFTASNIYITGKNRTPLAVILCLFCSWPCMFICGSRAEMPKGYEYDATVANDTSITL